jgi:hypothetical protein
VLPGRYRTGRQQDVSEFKGFLFEALDAAWSARGGAASSVVQRLFGGRQATVRTCMTCQQSTWTMEACVDFTLPTPIHPRDRHHCSRRTQARAVVDTATTPACVCDAMSC